MGIHKIFPGQFQGIVFGEIYAILVSCKKREARNYFPASLPFIERVWAMVNDINRLQQLISDGREGVWYNGAAWEHMRQAVLKMDHYECQRCKARGRYRKAEIVHHVKHLKDRPDLALSIYDPDTGDRQLISVCKQCHEDLHPEVLHAKQFKSKDPVTAERWD